MYSLSFFTLGCKLNQLETEAVAGAFKAAGFPVLPWNGPDPRPLDIAVINTCTVTSRAEQKARRIIRLALKRAAALIVTGCYAQLDGDKIDALDGAAGRLFVVPGRAKDSLLDLPAFLAGKEGPPVELLRTWMDLNRSAAVPAPAAATPVPAAAFRFAPAAFSFHSRAFLKIQDGCDGACAYCRVPLARGGSVSLDPREALTRLRALEAAGMAEAVLTGVNIMQYAGNLNGEKLDLGGLLTFLLEGTSGIALRLSSIEPPPAMGGRAGGNFFRVLGQERIRPHFHLSLQSGSGRVLSAMGRPYTAGEMRDTAAALREIKDDPFLACDVITGFPGESPGDFEETYTLCRDLDFAWIHGFPYSPRPGTGAFTLKNRVGREESQKRLERLLELSFRGRERYIKRWVGRTVEAVVLGTGENGAAPFFAALSANYLNIVVKTGGNAPLPGSAIKCRISGAFGEKKAPKVDAFGESVIY